MREGPPSQGGRLHEEQLPWQNVSRRHEVIVPSSEQEMQHSEEAAQTARCLIPGIPAIVETLTWHPPSSPLRIRPARELEGVSLQRSLPESGGSFQWPRRGPSHYLQPNRTLLRSGQSPFVCRQT